MDELQPALVPLKASRGLWQQFFLDVGAGFWEQWPDAIVSETLADDAYRHVEYAGRYSLRGMTILDIACRPAAPGGAAQILIRLSLGMLSLAPLDAQDMESPSVLSFVPI